MLHATGDIAGFIRVRCMANRRGSLHLVTMRRHARTNLSQYDSMRTTRTQPPNMKGRKLYMFSCGCCWARNYIQEELERIAWREVETELIESYDVTDEVEEVSK